MMMGDTKLMVPNIFKRKTEFKSCDGSHYNTDDVNIAIEKAQKKELLLLHRNFRALEQHHARSRIHSSMLKQQNFDGDDKPKDAKFQILAHLMNDKASLESTLARVSTTENEMLIKNAHDISIRLLDHYDNYVDVIQFCIGELRESENAVDRVVSTIVQVALKLREVTFHVNKNIQLAKNHAESLESRLYTLTKCYDTHCWRIAKSRKEITIFLLERKHFFNRLRMYRKRIRLIKNEIIRVVNDTHLCYDYIEEAKYRDKSISNQNHKESIVHALDIKEQARIVTNDEKQHRFHRIKNKPRERIEKESARRTRILQSQLDNVQKILFNYMKAFKEIKKVSGETQSNFNSAALMLQYQSIQECNFILFRYNNDMSHEVNVILMEIKKIKKKIQLEKQDRKKRNKEISEKMQIIKKRLETLEHQHIQRTETWEKSQNDMQFIVETFQKVVVTSGSESSAILRLLGKGNIEGIQPSILNVLLRVIEDRIMYLKNMKNFINNLGKSHHHIYPIDVHVPSHHSEAALHSLLRRNDRSSSVDSSMNEYHGGIVGPKIIVTPLFEIPQDGDEEEKLFRLKVYTRSEMHKYCLDQYYIKYINQANNSNPKDKVFKSASKKMIRKNPTSKNLSNTNSTIGLKLHNHN